MNATIHHGDCLNVLRGMPDNSVDAVVCDPPYGLSNTTPEKVTDTIVRWAQGDREHVPTGKGFMGASWDAFVPPPAVWDECCRVLKPGGHLVVFAGSRTQDLMGLSVRLAGFDLRDSLAWISGSGFPKSRNIGKDTGRPQDEGLGTALKPAHEPIILARKPLGGRTVAANTLEWGTGGLNIDATRIGTDENLLRKATAGGSFRFHGFSTVEQLRVAASRGEKCPDGTAARPTYARYLETREEVYGSTAGRWPANVLLDPDTAQALDQQSGTLKSGSRKAGNYRGLGYMGSDATDYPEVQGNEGGASRFFKVAEPDPPFLYAAKAPKRERPNVDGVQHPTVKPLSVMRWLVRLVTPEGGTVLDPFAGSGTTIEAALLEGMVPIGIEAHEPYLPLIQERINRATEKEAA